MSSTQEWFATRSVILLVPLVGVAYPLLKVLPGLYGWTMRRRIFRLYGELKVIEIEAEAPRAAAGSAEGLLARLRSLDEQASHLRVPQGMAWLAYTLRQHIRLVRERLERGL